MRDASPLRLLAALIILLTALFPLAANGFGGAVTGKGGTLALMKRGQNVGYQA